MPHTLILTGSHQAYLIDERIVIVGITEADIQRAKTYPIPDGVIAELINQLQPYQPAVIGLDIVRDLFVEQDMQL